MTTNYRTDSAGHVPSSTITRAPVANTATDEASLRAIAASVYRFDSNGITGSIVNSTPNLTPEQRAGLIAVIVRVDGNNVRDMNAASLATKHDVYLCGVAIGSWRREIANREYQAQFAALLGPKTDGATAAPADTATPVAPTTTAAPTPLDKRGRRKKANDLDARERARLAKRTANAWRDGDPDISDDEDDED